MQAVGCEYSTSTVEYCTSTDTCRLWSEGVLYYYGHVQAVRVLGTDMWRRWEFGHWQTLSLYMRWLLSATPCVGSRVTAVHVDAIASLHFPRIRSASPLFTYAITMPC